MTSDPIARYLSQRTAKFDRRTRLRTMTNAEIVDTGLRIYQVLGWTFLKLSAVPSLFSLAALAFVTRFIFPQLFVTSAPTNKVSQIGEVSVAIALGLAIGGPLLLIGFSYTTALVTQLVSDYMAGNVPSQDAARQAARRAVPTLLKLNLRTLLLSSMGLLLSIALLMASSFLADRVDPESRWVGLVALLAVCGIIASSVVMFLIVAWEAIATPIVVIENKKAADAARRSRQLLKGSPYIVSGYQTIFNVYLILVLVSAGMLSGLYGTLALVNYNGQSQSFVSGLPFGPLLLSALQMLPIYLFVWTVIPAWAVIVTVIYFERRVRVEGYDIEALAGDVWRSDRQNRFEL